MRCPEVAIVDAHGDEDHEGGLTEADRMDMVTALLQRESLRLLTVGIDIGSSTSHLLFARVLFQRQGSRASARFVPVERTVEWRSPIMLTPFLPDGTIDAGWLSGFVRRCYAEAGLTAGDVDTGAVILTGEAIKRRNARAINEIFAGEAGKFVCASAGHRLEATLAAHGSGATALSRARGTCGLHVDIGGGTTKLALIDQGEILSVAAFAVGGRLIARDGDGAWTRVDEPAGLVAAELGLGTSSAQLADPAVRRRIAGRLADIVADQVTGLPADNLGRALWLTEPLFRTVEPEYVTFSGGVAEYLFGHETEDHGDIARDLATALDARLRARLTFPLADPGQRIRATVIGASQFSAQLSGSTIHLGGLDALPLRNVPVVRLEHPLPGGIDPGALAAAFERRAARQDVDTGGPVALAFSWSGPVSYLRLAAVARAIAWVAGPADGRDDARGSALIVVVDADIAQSLGAILAEETGLRRRLIVLDGVELTDFDFVDVGEYLNPPGVLPVLIKSLLFAADVGDAGPLA
jgi:ethanolamine utilization protein EutA (predicted chaperonin)